MKTAEAATMDAQTFFDAETSLMKLSDVVTTAYFTTRERSEEAWEAFG